MPNQYVDRYDRFKSEGEVKPIPGLFIPKASTDRTIVYKQDRTRLDRISQEYYGNPFHGWLILSANPEYGGLEFDIPDRTLIRVPFPFDSAIERYIREVEKHLRLYGE